MAVRHLELDIAEPEHRELALHHIIVGAERVRGAAVLMRPVACAFLRACFVELNIALHDGANQTRVGSADALHLLRHGLARVAWRDDEVRELLGKRRVLQRCDMHADAHSIQACGGDAQTRIVRDLRIGFDDHEVQVG